jgi:hypothetical protein
MTENEKRNCPECVEHDGVDRRGFMRAVGGTAAVLAAGSVSPRVWADPQPATANRTAKPAEALIQELYSGLSQEQKTQVVMPWNHGAGANQIPTRLRMYNAPINAHRIGTAYTPAQRELVERILKGISNGEDGYRKMTRGGTFDGSRSFDGCGAYIFGDPTNNRQYSWVFAGHHLTVRCDGNSEPDYGFGGPMYYGHSPDGHSARNVFNFQTRAVQSVYDALDGAQRRRATITNPGERSIQFRRDGFPGIRSSDLTADQRALVETVMRTLLAPYRREDADEVMDIIRRNGGLERLHLGFVGGDATRWNLWRIEGPGFVWNYRVLPHVHTFVNISSKQA